MLPIDHGINVRMGFAVEPWRNPPTDGLIPISELKFSYTSSGVVLSDFVELLSVAERRTANRMWRDHFSTGAQPGYSPVVPTRRLYHGMRGDLVYQHDTPSITLGFVSSELENNFELCGKNAVTRT